MSAGPALTWLMDLAQSCDVFLFLQQGGWVVGAGRAWGGINVKAVPVSSESAKRAPGGQQLVSLAPSGCLAVCAEGVTNVGHPGYT